MFKLSVVLPFITRAVIAAASGVAGVQAAQDRIEGGTGADKREAVLDLFKTELAAVEFATGHKLANDADILAAGGTVIDAIAALHKVAWHKAGGAPTK